MQRHIMEKYQAERGEELIKLDPYMIRCLSIIPNQTFLRLKGYNIAGALAFISFKETHLIVVLSERETALLQSLRGSLGAFLLAVEKPGLKEPLRLHIPVSVLAVDAIPGRSNIALLKLQLRNIPPDLMEMICNLFDEIEGRKAKYERYGVEMVDLDKPESKLPGLQKKASIQAGGKLANLELVSLSTLSVSVTVVDLPNDFPLAGNCLLKINGPTGPITVEGELQEQLTLGSKASIKLQFSNDIISILDAIHDRQMHFKKIKEQYEAQKTGQVQTTPK